MHLKNFSLITRGNKVELSPAYDLLNISIILKAEEEIALPIRGKKKKLKRTDFIDYLGLERMDLSVSVLNEELVRFENAINPWNNLVSNSFLSEKMQDLYKKMFNDRWKRLIS